MTDADAVLGTMATAQVALDRAYATGKYVVAHNRLAYLSPGGLEEVIAGRPAPVAEVEDAKTGTWETVFAFRRDLWETIGGFDPRFRGFGHQVEAFFHAAKTLFGAERMTGFCYHLWHPYSADAPNPAQSASANLELVQRYWAASDDQVAMRALLNEYAAANV